MTTEELRKDVISNIEDSLNDWGMLMFMEYSSNILNHIERRHAYYDNERNKYNFDPEELAPDVDMDAAFKIVKETYEESAVEYWESYKNLIEMSKKLDCDVEDFTLEEGEYINEEKLNELVLTVVKKEIDNIKERLGF